MTKKTVLEEAIEKAISFVQQQTTTDISKSSCVKVGIYVLRPQPQGKPLGISYIITLQRSENGEWVYNGHRRHIPSIDYAKVTNVDPIIQYCN